MLQAGIVGLPNVGKSTLFNALTKSRKAMAANYRFCTIEPNEGMVTVPDDRLAVLSKLSGSEKLIPAVFQFVDIAGLVAGASKGEGLGNQFLAHIREVDAIVQVVRCFENSNIEHVMDTVDPVRDIEIINTELLLADMDSLEKQKGKLQKLARSGDKKAAGAIDLIARLEKVERMVLSALIASSIVMSVVGVFYRYVLGHSLAYVEEFAGLIMAAVIVLGSSLAITSKEHIRVELMMQVFPQFHHVVPGLQFDHEESSF